MKVIKRNGRSVDFNPVKITKRIKEQSLGLNVDSDKLSISVISQMADNIKTKELDNLCTELASTNVSYHYDYSRLASRLFVTSLRKDTPDIFSEAVKELSQKTSMLADEYVEFVKNNALELNNMIVQDRDFDHDIFGLRTLERSYLMRDEFKNIIERPQYMWMRVAIEVSAYDIDRIKETYDAMSLKKYTHATPTLFNACTKLSQLSSCFLIANKGDDIDGLFDTMKDVANISKLAGGIGLHVHNVRAEGSHIKGTNGKSDGLLPMMKTYNEIARWINQGGRRKGSFAIYLEPWHADIFDFLELRKNHGKEEMRARDLFYAMWTPDLLMERVRDDGDWSLFCPNEVLKATGKKLQETYGEDFNKLYQECVDLGIARKTIKARELWEKILTSQIETGTPYISYKDRANKATNQQNLGVIQSSNLCFTGDTLVVLDNGKVRTIKELSDYSKGEIKFKVISAYNDKDNCSYIKEVREAIAFSNGKKEVITLTLSDGSKFRCTEDHELFTCNNSKIKAKDSLNCRLESFDSKDKQYVLNIEYLGEVEDVYDLTVDDNHNFFIITKEDKNNFNFSIGVLVSNCNEIYEYSDKDEQAVCNLASIGLPAFVLEDSNRKLYFDFEELGKTVRLSIRNLDNVIDANYYPTKETEASNMRHRPVGCGTQGLADVFALLKMPFDSPEAKELNRLIYEHIYYNALVESNKLAVERGSYDSFPNSPASKGILQFDMYEEKPNLSSNLDWDGLTRNIIKDGLRNSLLIALMPTASTSQILGYNEAFEPFTSNMYTRGTLSGTFVVVNKYLIKELEKIGIWDLQMRKELMANNGSVMNIARIPAEIKEVYKTVYELSMKTIIDMASDRQRFVCQGQSMNLFVDKATFAKLSSMHMYSWNSKLKTGMYYLRTKPAVDAIKFTVSKETEKTEEISQSEFKAMIERSKNAEPDDCEMCGS